jgi:hypothetical protein
LPKMFGPFSKQKDCQIFVSQDCNNYWMEFVQKYIIFFRLDTSHCQSLPLT